MGGIHPVLREIHQIGDRTRERLLGPQECPPLSRHGIRLLGTSEAWPGFAFRRVSPPGAQILVTVSGAGDVHTAGGWETSGPGSAYLTPAGLPHAYRAVSDAGPWQVCWVTYDAEADAVPVPGPTLVTSLDPEPLAAAIQGLLAEVRGHAGDALLANWAAMVDACARRAAAAPAPGDPRLGRLFREVAQDPARPWTLDEMARRAAMSDEHLRRLCHARFGRSPVQQVAHLRMQQAATLLASGRYTIERAAEAVGYTNAFAFSAAFKRSHGRPPSQYRACSSNLRRNNDQA